MWRFLIRLEGLYKERWRRLPAPAFQIVQCSGRLRKTSEGLKPFGGCLPQAPFFKMPQLYSRLGVEQVLIPVNSLNPSISDWSDGQACSWGGTP
jgi:hypothetical protein